MHGRRLRSERWVATGILGLVLLVSIGCSPQGELSPDSGVSPDYPETGGLSPPAAGPGATLEPARVIGRTSPGRADSTAREEPLRTEDVERQLRIALRTGARGDSSGAIVLLDRILSLEPLNREALSGRASIGLEQAKQAPTPSERAAALARALDQVRTLRRAHEKATKPESDLFGRALYANAQMASTQGREDQALALLKEAYDEGYEPFDQVEKDETMAALRASSGYRELVRQIDDENLAKARDRTKGHLEHPLPLALEFTLPDLEGNPITLSQFRGKVVVIDIWGTWCKPCRAAIPGLIRLYRKHHRRGLEIVGIDFEQNALDADASAAVPMVKAFVQQAGVPYPCVIGDRSIIEKIPDFHAFPTSIVIDRAGKVRLLVTENAPDTLDRLDDVVTVLLAQPEPPATQPGPAPPPLHPAQPAPRE